jgi:cell division protein FtsI/penicillin-binding protein 2
MSKGFASNYRIVLLSSLVFVALAGLAGRLVWLQVLNRDELLSYVERSRREVIVENARRGDILDARGNILATSLPMREVGVDPQVVRPEDRSKWPQLAALLGLPLPEVEAILTTRFRPAAAAARAPEGVGQTRPPTAAGSGSLVVSFNVPGDAPAAAEPQPAAAQPEESQPVDNADDDTQLDDPDADGRRPIKWARLSEGVAESTYAKIMELGIAGIYGNRIYRRDYPDNSLAAHVIGWVNHDEKPVAGIESFADFYLRGQNGWVETEKDGHQKELAQFRSRDVPATDGYNVQLSIDATVQQIAQDELAYLVRTYQPHKATIIIGDPRTGFILALANYPSFNPNEYNKVPRDDMRAMNNIAATDEYEPGSVFKIVSASGALNEGLVTPGTTFDCSLETVEYRDPSEREPHLLKLPREFTGEHFKTLSVAEILEHSSNKGAAQLGMMLGKDRLYHYARAFGFGEPTDFPMGGDGEIRGDLPPPARWYPITITRIPMGQSVAATPLQMHQAMGVIASGGLLMRPQVIREVRDSNGALVFHFEPAVVRRVIRPEIARSMARMLMGVVSPEGTAPAAAVPGYEVAGKTGTAQKLESVLLPSGKTELRYADNHHVCSFVGFFPATEPQVAISVIVDDPDAHVSGLVSGAKVAAPSFRRIAEELIAYNHLDIHKPAGPAALAPALAMAGGHP